MDKINVFEGGVLEVKHDTPVPAKFSSTDDLVDPNCDPNNPRKIAFSDVTSAAVVIKGGVVRTPCTRCTTAEKYGFDLYLKKEFMQYTGSFKERGARYTLLSLTDEQKRKGVISASAGNHAQGISYHGWKLDIPVTVVMPVISPIMKIQKCRNYKARVVVQGANMAEAKAIAMRMAKDENLLYVNGYDHENVLAGQGTIGLEILEDVPKPDAVVVPVGGAGLIAGIATSIKAMSPSTQVIGVESVNSPGFAFALQNNGPTYAKTVGSLADGLAVPVVGYNSYFTTAPLLDKMVVVREEYIALAILRLVEEEKCVVEGAGATGLAAILSGHLDFLKGKTVVLVLSGGNIDTTVLGRCLERGLAAEGRLVRFKVAISDRPGGLQHLCDLLVNLGVSIKDISHERAWLKDVYSVEVKVIAETRDWAHSTELKEALEKEYTNLNFPNEPLLLQMR